MPRIPKRCESCQRPYHAVRQNQTYCRPCRYLKEASYWASPENRATKCRLCGSLFRRTRRSDTVCAKCDVSPHVGTCIACGTENAALERHGIPVCLGCSRHPDVEARKFVLLVLRRHLGIDQPTTTTEHPAHAAAMRKAEAASQRLGLADAAQAIARAKADLGVDRVTTAAGYLALGDALDALR